MHPIERLRYVARAGGAPPSSLVSEAAAALASLGDDPAAMVTACRRLVERHPHVGPMWWLASRVLTSPEPAAEAWRVVEELEHDMTSRLLAAELGESAAVVLLGWPELAGSAVMRRGDLAVMLVDPLGEADGLVRRLRSSGGDVLEVPLVGLAQAVAAADVVLLEAMALGGRSGWTGAERSGPDRAGADRAGADGTSASGAGVDSGWADGAGAVWAGAGGPDGAGASGAGADVAGAVWAGASGAGADRAGAGGAGADRAGAGGAGADRAGAGGAGAVWVGAGGADGAGAVWAGASGAGADRVGVDGGGAVVASGSWAAAAVARSVGVPTWLVAGAGRVLPARVWEALVRRLDDDSTEPWDRAWEVLPGALVGSVAGPEGLVSMTEAFGRADFAVAAELLSGVRIGEP